MSLDNPLYQQIISYIWRTRFTTEERKAIKEAAYKLQDLFAEHDIIDVGEPRLDPGDIDVNNGIGEDQILEAVQYVTGMKNQADADTENIEEIIEDPVYDTRLEHTWNEYNGQLHKMTIAYLPGGEYSLFVMNGWIDPDRTEALTRQYRQRWRIENEYKSIKENFLPKAATPDYRNRFMYWIIGVIMYNVWRLTNFELRDEVDENLEESPPVPAGDIVEIIGLCLCGEDPGG